MPPRSYYIDPRPEDFIAYARAFFPEDVGPAIRFIEENKRPYVANEIHLAAYVGVSPKLIRQILYRPRFHYRRFQIPKADGTKREIFTPKTYLKVLQWWILDNVLSGFPLSECAHGFRKNFSYVSNARKHFGNNHILNVDIEKFFQNINKEMIFDLFVEIGYPVSGAEILASLTSLNGAAPTGAPTSPAIGNLVLRNVDRKLEQYANDRNLVYTRYADDLTFSSEKWVPTEIIKDISEIIEMNGFRLNIEKTHFMGRGDRMEVTGVVINSKLNTPRFWRNKVRGYLHKVIGNPLEYSSSFDRVSGIYGTLKAVDPNEDKKLTKMAREALAAISGGSQK